jgi:hypothetical protein
MMAPMKSMVRVGDLMLGAPPSNPAGRHAYLASWLSLWTASATMGAALAYYGYDKKNKTYMLWGVGEALFGLYKLKQTRQQLLALGPPL